MPELPRRVRRLLVVLHVVVSVGWLGAGAANLALATAAATGSDALDPHSAYLAIELIDTCVVIPAAFAALATGVVLSVGTSWGLTRHWWVLAKLCLTVGIIAFSTFGVGVWVERLAAATADLAPGPADLAPTAPLLVAGAGGNVVGFVVMTWLSVAKPRGRTPWSRLVGTARADGLVTGPYRERRERRSS